MENEKRKNRRWLPNAYWQIGIEIVVLLIVLYGFGLLLQSRVEGLLNDTVEVSVSRQAADMDALAEERFKHEHEALHTAATMIVDHPEQEQATLKARAAELQAELGQAQEAAVNVEKFMAVVRKYTSFEELTPTLLREFVEKIVVHECWKDEQGTRHQDIEIYYSFVGKVDLPDD